MRAARIAAACVAYLLAAAVAGGPAGPPSAAGAPIENRLQGARERLDEAVGRERVLTADVARYGDRIRDLEAQLAPMRERSARLDQELAALQARLAELSRQLAEARARLAGAEAALARRRELLAIRLRELYVRGEPGLIEVLLQSDSLTTAVETVDLMERIADRDAGIAEAVKRYADQTRRTRDAISRAQREAADAEARKRVAAVKAREAKAALEAQRADVAQVLGQRQALLDRVRVDRRQLEAETRDLEARSARLTARIQAAQGSGAAVGVGSAPSASGFAWPVSGTLTSPFGPRWGRVHEGIDIAGSSGTPIRASAAGTVILAGWSGGYGNLVVVDHGNGYSTAYAHNSTIAVAVGQRVSQGTVLAGMGTTGNSTGVHSHFEVRVNGSAVDPLGYL